MDSRSEASPLCIFLEGRLLPTPEVVPFRLTRDLVHALGPMGLEAGFTRAAESALQAFSSGSDIIVTLLEVGLVSSPFRVLLIRPPIGAGGSLRRLI